jgi:tRNA uridine 5-carboxymethylaminomethyl modification enzyme
VSVTSSEAFRFGIEISQDGKRRTGFELLSFKDVSVPKVVGIWPQLKGITFEILELLEIEAGYSVYLKRQKADILAILKDESLLIPGDFSYDRISGLSNEIKFKLKNALPGNLGQAARIDGITPAALTLLLAHIKLHTRSIERAV